MINSVNFSTDLFSLLLSNIMHALLVSICYESIDQEMLQYLHTNQLFYYIKVTIDVLENNSLTLLPIHYKLFTLWMNCCSNLTSNLSYQHWPASYVA